MSSSGREIQPGEQGIQGEPGGFTTGTLLNLTHLDTVTTPGLYRQTDSSGNSSPMTSGYPNNGFYGTIAVYETHTGLDDVIQVGYQQNYAGAVDARRFYMRNRSNAVWSPWRVYASTRVDQTAGRAIYTWDDLNSREQLTYGDTGWRNISDQTLNGDAASSIQIRRTQFQVHVRASTNPAAGGDFFNWPAGFGPDGSTYFSARYSGAVDMATIYADTAKIALSGYTTGKGGVFFTASFSTSAAWPASLPGAAVGPIPYA